MQPCPTPTWPSPAATSAGRQTLQSPLVTPAELTDHHPDLILGCFENDARSRNFWTREHVTAAITEHRPARVELSTLPPERSRLLGAEQVCARSRPSRLLAQVFSGAGQFARLDGGDEGRPRAVANRD
ncbi:hypothetical protein [Kitasatospora sp. NPDC056531]|uniref:hypothetical protein n=1 Tax=Kitasatospora sp. NPDC056531 TaxID=3345856 RepID=UPI00367F784A